MLKRLLKILVKYISLEITVKRREVHWKSKMLSRLLQSVGAKTQNDVSLCLVLERGNFRIPLDEDGSGRSAIYRPNKSVMHIDAGPRSAKVNN